MPTQSYAWSHRLNDVVAPGANVTVQTPGFEMTENCEEAQIGLDGKVLKDEEFSLDWADDHSSIVVTNESDTDWQPAQTLYVTVPSMALDPDNVGDNLNALEDRVSSLETQVDDHETRIAALEGGGGGATVTRVKTEGGSVSRAKKNDQAHHNTKREHPKAQRKKKSGQKKSPR